jgi:hypothetical protein
MSLRLPAFQRAVLLGVFSLGFIVVLAGCFRAYWVYEVVTQTYDVTWHGYMLWIWTAVEVNSGVICGCVPTLRPLFQPQRRSSNGSRGTSSNHAPHLRQYRVGAVDAITNTPHDPPIDSIKGRFYRLFRLARGYRSGARSESLHSGPEQVEMRPAKSTTAMDVTGVSPAWGGSETSCYYDPDARVSK